MNTFSTSHAWANLIQHHEKYGDLSLSERFNTSYDRAEQLSFSCGDLWIDVSKQLLEVETTELLFELAEEREVGRFFDDMFKGNVVNFSEKQRALHIYLRDPKIHKWNKMFGDVSEEAHENLERMKDLAERLENGWLIGATGKQIRSVVNLGIGGSHLGPFMAFEALKRYVNPELEVRWSSGLDKEAVIDALKGLDPEETIIIICSKTFKTAETMGAAGDCKEWLKEGIEQAKWDIGMVTPLREEYLDDDEWWEDQLEPNPTLSSHMFAATSIPKNALDFGIEQVNIFRFSETIGGRFSLASPVSLGLILSIGYENFRSMLDGMHLIDEHVRENRRNVPLLLGLIDVWNRSILGSNSLAIVPYSYRLRKLVPYIQQLMMESLGKSVSQKGERLGLETGGAVWGASGTDAQHSFFQLLHQGTESIPIDLIGIVVLPDDSQLHLGLATHRENLISNLIAQAEVLAFGNSLEENFDPHLKSKIVPGNKPSTVILAPNLSPGILGQLVALYEHRTIAAGAIWGINPFDQWGVELGKKTAGQIFDELRPWDGEAAISDHDSSTQSLMTLYMSWEANRKPHSDDIDF